MLLILQIIFFVVILPEKVVSKPNIIMRTWQYHAGYREQMSHWPSQPLESIIRWLKKRTTSLVVADFGCGEFTLFVCIFGFKRRVSFSFLA